MTRREDREAAKPPPRKHRTELLAELDAILRDMDDALQNGEPHGGT